MAQTVELWGGETRKAVENFPVSGERVPVPVIRWLGRIKAAAARTNAELGLLDRELGELADDALARLTERQQVLAPGGYAGPGPGTHPLAVCDGFQDPMCLVAAARALKQQGAERVSLAIPVAEHKSLPAYAAAFDEVISIYVSADPPTMSEWYADGRGVSDEEVITLLRGVHRRAG